MTAAEAARAVAHLLATYPTATLEPASIRVYEKSLKDFTESEVLRAINQWAATQRFFPTIADVRELVFEERLQLPSPSEAWELVQARIAFRCTKWEPCVKCARTGVRLYEPGDDDRTREEVACDACNGRGEIPLEHPPAMDDVTRRAVDFIGGLYAIRTSQHQNFVRNDFLEAHAKFRAESVRTANLVSLGVLEPAARRAAIEAAS